MFLDFLEFVVINCATKLSNKGAVIKITGSKTVIKNIFGFGIQISGYERESILLHGRFQCTYTNMLIES